MISIIDLFSFLNDRRKYKHLEGNLYWFKKNKKFKWIQGQNFGDYLSVIIVGKLLEKLGTKSIERSKFDKRRLLAVGSILHFAKNNDVIWGSGINGKVDPLRHKFDNLDVRMVRGPKTKDYLNSKGIEVEDVYGDPVLLLPTLYPNLKHKPINGKVIILPNLNEIHICKNLIPTGMKLVSPMSYWSNIIKEILSSELVLTSSLHGIVVAESFGVPVRFVKPFGGETLFKYQDYYLGTGRELTTTPKCFKDGITRDLGFSMPKPAYDINKMINSFPVDFFKNSIS